MGDVSNLRRGEITSVGVIPLRGGQPRSTSKIKEVIRPLRMGKVINVSPERRQSRNACQPRAGQRTKVKTDDWLDGEAFKC